jgi:hypothetical protein
MKRLTLVLLTILLCGILSLPIKAQQPECQPPALPKSSEPNIFTEEQEVFLGEAVAEQIQKNYRVIEDPALTDYLSRIGERLVKHLPITSMRLQFFLVDLPDVNAFVLPGGRIYVSRKLVTIAQSEDELAGVIGHELGHLAARESAIDTTRRFKEVLGVTEVKDRSDIFEKYNQLIDNLRRKPEAFKSRDREKGQMVADQIGFYALTGAGYDPAALARFWDRMTEAKGKTGNWLSDLFGATRPEERRLREMLKAVSTLPAGCMSARPANQAEDYKQWQSSVISYTGLGRREVLPGFVSKQQLQPPLRSDITHIRFSPDGRFVLAQDDSGINVLSREPFAPLFRIEVADAYNANFTPDSKEVVFYTDNLRVERWSVAEQKMLDAKEVVVRRGCMQTSLSPDGKYLACLSPNPPYFDLNLINVQTGETALQKKEFYSPNFFQILMIIDALGSRGRGDSTDIGLELVRMGFSTDARYFMAGYLGHDHMNPNLKSWVGEAVDLNTFAKVSIPDSMKKLIAGGFTFIGNDRIAAVNIEDYRKSAILTFPKGELVAEYPMRGRLEAPTLGNYLLIRPIKDFALGVMNLDTKVIFKANKQPALDIYGDIFVAEMRNGELGLYRMEKNEVVATALLSNFNLGRLLVAELSGDMKWLALSGRSRGGVWNLNNKAEAALYLRGFRGAYFDGDATFFGDFPKYETAERNVARFNLANGEVTPGSAVESRNARQIGPYLLVVKPAKSVKENDNYEYGRNVIVEMQDARSLTPLWSKTYPKETPRVWVAGRAGTMALVWDVTDDAARAEIKSDSKLSQRLAGMKEKEGDYFIQILDARTGSELGKLLVETGKGSFRLSNVFAAGDWVIITDTQNRVLVYSLKTGEMKGRVFGGYATVSPAANLLCVENESGKLAVYDLNTMEKRGQITFSSPVALVRFTEDGKRLFVLTSNQTAYVLDTNETTKGAATAKQN